MNTRGALRLQKKMNDEVEMIDLMIAELDRHAEILQNVITMNIK